MRALVIVMALAAAAGAEPKKKHALPLAKSGGTVVGLCDGETSIEVPAPASRADAQRLSDQLMTEWRKKHPDAHWDDAMAANGVGQAAPPAPKPGTQVGTYNNFTDRDQFVWNESTQKFVDEGSRIFHDAKQLGGTIAVSCDMCHPNGANTHPETYPKFQVQLGRVALLRDMINWCIENPVKGKPFADDDDRLRALEAYIYAQRKGTKLDYGRH
jgi:cytochrome c